MIALLSRLFGVNREQENARDRLEDVDRRSARLEKILEAEASETIRLEREGRQGWNGTRADGAR